MNKLFKKVINIEDSDIKELLLKGGGFMFIRIIGLLGGFVFAYLVSREYGASTYGLVSLSFSFFIVAGILSRLGLDINVVKYFSEDENLNEQGLFFRSLFKAVFVAVILGLCITYFGNLLSTRLFDKPQLEPYFFWIALALPFWTATQLFGGFLRSRKKSNWFAFLNNPGRFVFSFLIFLVFLGISNDPLSAIKAHFWANLVLCLVGLGIVLNTFGRITFKSRENSWLFLKESFPMMLSSTVLVLLGWTDTFILGIYESDQTIGVYNVALKIATLTSFSLQAINSILAPKLAQCYANKNQEQFNKLIAFSTKLNFILTLILVLVIVVFNNQILKMFGQEFIIGVFPLIILAVGQLINSISGSVGIIMQMTGKQKVYQNIVLLALIINISLNLSLIPVLGGLGAAIATALSIICWNVSGAWYLKKKMSITSYYTFK